MATLNEMVKLTLDECRMLVLGTQVLISIEFELAFQSGFSTAPPLTQHLVIVGLCLLLAAFILLLWGPAYHRIALDARHSHEALRFMTWTQCVALWPLAAALGVDAFIAFDRQVGQGVGIAMGIVTFCLCSLAWYGLALVARHSQPAEVKRAMKEQPEEPEAPSEKLHDRVNQVLTEARVVLPGAQAMLGFQFITFFEKQFQGLPAFVQTVHLVCLCVNAMAVVLLMTPAAFHRLAESGKESERLTTVASRCVIGAMLPLALAMSGDLFVVAMKITESMAVSLTCGAGALVVFLTLWFGYTLFCRQHRRARPQLPRASFAHQS
jgi:hypothetical protein